MDQNSLVTSVAGAITAALDGSSSPETRKTAIAYLDSIKARDTHILATVSFRLVRKDWPSEIRLHGFKLLQHLVRVRWDDFNIEERQKFVKLSVDLLSEMAVPHQEWVLKSQIAAIVAEVVRREGITLWQELLPSLVSFCNCGPIQAELVLMILRWLPEDITVHNEDLEGERRRQLLRGLTHSLPEILPLLYNLLEKHFGAALNEAGREHMDAAKQHAVTVVAALNALNAYAEWAPVSELAKYGLLHGCGFLLSSVEFRLHACEFFKLMAGRKRPLVGSSSAFDSAMSTIFHILINATRDILNRSNSYLSAGIDESELEFAECLSASMVFLGSSNLQCIIGDANVLHTYLRQMLGYFHHCKFSLHFQSLNFWLVLMRELVSKPKVPVQVTGVAATSDISVSRGQVDKEKKGLPLVIDDDSCGAVLDISFQRMLKKQAQSGVYPTGGTLELWSEEFIAICDFGQYRNKLLELIRHVTSYKPAIAASKISQRIGIFIKRQLTSALSAEDTAVLDDMQLVLETVVSVIFDTEFGSGTVEFQFSRHKILEDLLQELLSLNWTEPKLSEILGRYLGAFGPFLKHYPEAVSGVIKKLFDLLAFLPIDCCSGTSVHHARLEICFSFIRITKAADRSLLPHMKDIIDASTLLQREGHLLPGELNVLGEAFIIIAASAGLQQQREVLAWLLEPLSKLWSDVEWQNAYLSDPLGLIKLCSDRSFMWSIYHSITLFEKALKRSGFRKANIIHNESLTITDEGSSHVMAPHLSWILPPLLKLLRCVHSLWSPPVFEALSLEFQAALCMSQVEQGNLLGDSSFSQQRNVSPSSECHRLDANMEECPRQSDYGIRNWLKGIRESGYNVLGLSASIGGCFFKCLEGSSISSSLMEGIDSMEFRHIRQLIHLVFLPFVKFCPVDLWGEWLRELLHPLLKHCKQALCASWHSLLHDGRARVPERFENLSKLDLKVEVLEDRLLRGLTREICLLLSVMASPGLNSGLPLIEKSGHIIHVERSTFKDMEGFSRDSLVGFVLYDKKLAIPALQIIVNAFSWTDGEAVSKLISFCGALILLSVLTNNTELREFVAKDLFYSIIQGLMLESNAIISSNLVGLCREIFVYLSGSDPSPRQLLLSFSGITLADLQAFDAALAKTNSPKEQKQHIKNLLLLAAGDKLKAIAAQRSTNVITNVSRTRMIAPTCESNDQEDEKVGLAALT